MGTFSLLINHCHLIINTAHLIKESGFFQLFSIALLDKFIPCFQVLILKCTCLLMIAHRVIDIDHRVIGID